MSAQLLYAKELGLIVTDIQGNAIDLNHVKGAIIAHPDIHEDIINIIKRINKIILPYTGTYVTVDVAGFFNIRKVMALIAQYQA